MYAKVIVTTTPLATYVVIYTPPVTPSDLFTVAFSESGSRDGVLIQHYGDDFYVIKWF